jgi:hypothetical protein
MVSMSFGIGEIVAVLSAVIGIGWGLMKVSFAQFEKRLDTKFAAIDTLLLDVKKLELEQVRRDGVYAQQFASKDELRSSLDKHDKVVERIFSLLQTMSDKLDNKIGRDDCERLMMRKAERQ